MTRRGKIGKAGRVISSIVPPLGAWTDQRDAPPLASRSFKELWRAGLKNK
jgi:hypothetical protein